MGRPDWIPEEFAFNELSPDHCDFCSRTPLYEASTVNMNRFAFVKWCDSPECEQAAREAICGGEGGE